MMVIYCLLLLQCDRSGEDSDSSPAPGVQVAVRRSSFGAEMNGLCHLNMEEQGCHSRTGSVLGLQSTSSPSP